MKDAYERHNEISGQLVAQIVKAGGDLPKDFVLLESVICGVVLFHEALANSDKPSDNVRAAMVDKLFESVIGRLHDMRPLMEPGR